MPKISASGYDRETDNLTMQLKRAMTDHHMTQAGMARLLKVDQSGISRYLTNIDNMSVGRFRMMAKLLGLTVKLE